MTKFVYNALVAGAAALQLQLTREYEGEYQMTESQQIEQPAVAESVEAPAELQTSETQVVVDVSAEPAAEAVEESNETPEPGSTAAKILQVQGRIAQLETIRDSKIAQAEEQSTNEREATKEKFKTQQRDELAEIAARLKKDKEEAKENFKRASSSWTEVMKNLEKAQAAEVAAAEAAVVASEVAAEAATKKEAEAAPAVVAPEVVAPSA